MGVVIYQVDAFTDRPFAGNPAAVCLLDGPGDEAWMQSVANEMNLSETAFLTSGDDSFHLRWFTPQAEVDLCGHATLASAHILWESGLLQRHEMARFQTRSGLLTAKLKMGWIELNFPATPPEEAAPPPQLLDSLRVDARFVGRSRFDYLVEVAHEETVRSLQPDFSALARVDARGVMVTSRAHDAETDFVSRFFAPAVGVDEDPVTGSAHCCLAPFWAARMDKSELMARQVSARGGFLRLRIDGERVLIVGQAVTVLRGELG